VLLVFVVMLVLSCSEPRKVEYRSGDTPLSVDLPDGSTVTLREGASLTIVDNFGSGSREVVIEGEGYFEIKHDPRRRFIAHCNGVAVTVLGTAFNIRLSPKTGEVEVTVTQGKVNVSDATHDFGDVVSHRQVVIDPARHQAQYIEKFDLMASLGWYYEGLATGYRGMGDALSALELRYDTHITLENEALRHCVLKLQPDFNTSLDEILKVSVISVNARLIKKGNTYIIRGGSCQ
jgi:ferric-dicitrate binding protein FerR (iron transport regulator)